MPSALFSPKWLSERIQRLPFFRVGPKDVLPFCIGNRRIYVLPSGFGFFVGLSLAIITLSALNYNNNAALLLGFLLISACNNSLIAGHLALLGLRVQCKSVPAVFAGQALRLPVSIEPDKDRKNNTYTLRFQSNSIAVQLTDVICPTVLEIQTNRRGWFNIDRIQLSTRQPLGLAKAWSNINLHTKALVYPKPNGKSLHSALTASQGSDGRQTRQITDQPHHLRNFRPGDSRKQIAWKASARAGQLQVREYETSPLEDLILDWKDVAQLDYEQKIEQLCLWVLQAEQRQRPFALKLPKRFIAHQCGPEHQHACLKALALLPDEH